MAETRNLILQVWVGPIRPGVQASVDNIKLYANAIGADHEFSLDPTTGMSLSGVSKGYYDWMNPIVDRKYDKYDNIAVIDCDVYTPDGMTENIFDVPYEDFGICTEPEQPKLRAQDPGGRIGQAADEKWATILKQRLGIALPRDDQGLLKVYNAGVVLFSRAGIEKARKRFLTYIDYINLIRSYGMDRFYWLDQNYFHAMMVGYTNYTELNNDWNALIHYQGKRDDKKERPGYGRAINDPRTTTTKFAHVQLSEADHYDADKIWRIVNLPQEEWNL